MLNNQSNGHVILLNGTTFGSEASYYCESNFVLKGNHSRVCQENGSWSGAVPECKLILNAVRECMCVCVCTHACVHACVRV